MSLYFEDLDSTADMTTRGRTITEADIVTFAGLTGDFIELHTNEEFAKQTKFGRRVAHGALIDNALEPAAGSYAWVATIWRDASDPSGWRRLVWDHHPTGRGWIIHPMTHLADIIEFGADLNGVLDRWYGYASHADAASFSIVGPFELPNEAAVDAAASLGKWRLLGLK